MEIIQQKTYSLVFQPHIMAMEGAYSCHFLSELQNEHDLPAHGQSSHSCFQKKSVFPAPHPRKQSKATISFQSEQTFATEKH